MQYNKKNFYDLLKTGHFANMVQETVKRKRVHNSKQLFNIMRPLVEQEDDVEQFWVIYLDAKNKILEISCMSKGSLSRAMVYPREIIKKALKVKASAAICCHNHPSGDPEPSPEDNTLTFQLLIALRSVGIDMHEHMIIGNQSYYSYADVGAMASFCMEYDRFIKGK